MDSSYTIMKQTFWAVVGAGVFLNPPNWKIYVRWGHPGLRGSMGAWVPFEMWTYVTGLFPREGSGCCSCVVLFYSDPFYSSLKVQITKFRLLKNNFNFTSLKPPFKWIGPLWRAARAFWPLKKLFQIDFYPRGCVPSVFYFSQKIRCANR